MTDSNATEQHWKTKRLRALLEERDEPYISSEDDTTIFFDDANGRYTFNVNPESGWAQLFSYHLTPEQTVAATLGRGECEIRKLQDGYYMTAAYECSECGAAIATADIEYKCCEIKFCPNCGKAVKR